MNNSNTRYLTDADVRSRLETLLARSGSVEKLARELDIAWSYLYKMRTGERLPSRKLLDKLGLVEVVVYREAQREGKK